MVRGVGTPPRVEKVELPATGPGQVRVAVRAAGVCHSDLSMVDGTIAAPYPLLLGHEAAGVVVEVGADVDRIAVGDHVVLDWAPPCRVCWYCGHGEPWLCERSGTPAATVGHTIDGEPLHVTLGLGALAEQVVVPQHAVVAVPPDLPFATDAVECVGRAATIRAAWRATRRGGQVIVVGMGGKDDMVALSALEIFHSARTLRSSVYGSSDPDRDVPELARAVLDGTLDLDFLVTDRITLNAAPEALARMARGEGARTVVLFD